MNKYLLEKLVQSVGIYYSITNTLGYKYSNIPSDFNKSEMLVKYKDRYYDRKIGFVDVAGVRFEITVYNDVTDIKKQSMIDQKTGALTLDYFRKKVLDRVNSGEDVILCLMDIDDFKHINDTFGHHVGDLVLEKVVKSFKGFLGPNDDICRFGGDEFLVAINSNDVGEIRNKMDEYASYLRTNLAVDDNMCLDITFSIGVTKYIHDEDFDTNFNQVDSAMYFCKKHGKNGVVSKEIYVKVLEK